MNPFKKGSPPIIFFILIISVFNMLTSADKIPAILVRNTLEETEAGFGKLKLQLIREWGGDSEQDEYKYFKLPNQILVQEKKLVYVCDMENNHIKVFTYDGQYLRTIGRHGRGPGDLYWPGSMALSPLGNLWVHELGGRRIQCFDPQGKSIQIFKALDVSRLIGVSSNDNLVIYNHFDMINSGSLVKILSAKGEIINTIGTYHDPYKNPYISEPLLFKTDIQDSIYALNTWVPVIRKYNSKGQMVMAITVETPYSVPYKVTLNPNRSEIQRVEQKIVNFDTKKNARKGRGGIISTKIKGEIPYAVVAGFDVDSEMRLFLVLEKRLKTLEERKASRISWNSKRGFKRRGMDFSILNKIDVYRLLVFNASGKIIASVDLKTPAGTIYVNDDRLYNIDRYNLKITEYKMEFKE